MDAPATTNLAQLLLLIPANIPLIAVLLLLMRLQLLLHHPMMQQGQRKRVRSIAVAMAEASMKSQEASIYWRQKASRP
jgi:hypothetical protein